MANSGNILDMMTSNENLSRMYGIQNQSCTSCACAQAQRNQQAQAAATGTTNNNNNNVNSTTTTTTQVTESTNTSRGTRAPVYMESINGANVSGENTTDEETEEYIEESLSTTPSRDMMTSDDSLNALLSTMSGGMVNQLARGNQTSNTTPCSQQGNGMCSAMSMPRRSATEVNLQNMNGFLKTQTGKNISIQFLIGNNALLEKTGTLLAVGDNYILMRESDNNDIILCDFDNIKFIKFLSE